MDKRTVTVGDETFEIDLDSITLKDAFAIEAESGLTVSEMLAGFDRRKALACQTFVWFLRMKAGNPCSRIDIDFPVLSLTITRTAESGPLDTEDVETVTSEHSPTSAD